MGNGRIGLSKTGGKPVKWNLSSANASSFGITLKKNGRLSANEIGFDREAAKKNRETYLGYIDEALDTVNKMGVLLGLRPSELPEVEFFYGAHGADGTMGYFTPSFRDVGRIHMLAAALENKQSLDTAAHEFIHAIEASWIKQDHSVFLDRINAWQNHTYSEAIVLNAMGKKKYVESEFKAWASKIYRTKWEMNNPSDAYATKMPAEAITCAVQSVLRYGKSAPPNAWAIIRELKKEVRRHRKSSKNTK